VGDSRLQLPLLIAVLLCASVQGFDANSLPQVGYHPGGISYWSCPYYCNALAQGQWLEYGLGQWGTAVSTWDNPQFDANGFPRYLNPGKSLRGICFGLHCDYADRPATWPVRYRLAQGHVVLTWKGSADIRLNGGTFVAAESNCGQTGRGKDGRRVYLFTGTRHVEWLDIMEINSQDPVTDVKVWLADPGDSQRKSLEGRLFHPMLLQRLADADWGFIRFMDLLSTNANPQQDWSDRRLASHCFTSGDLNPRSPATGFGGGRGTGIAYEHAVSLCNQAGKDLWVCVPHRATDEFVTRLAQLIRYGSDGREPYSQEAANPVHPGLAGRLRVYIEYSNEIWSNGDAFCQGNWAQEQAKALNLSKAQFNARRFCQVWRIFQQVFGGTDRLVRVASVFTASSDYTRPFLQEMAAYGPTLDPATGPDAIAATTYFGNGIQDYVYERAQSAAASSDPWFLTTESFTSGSMTRPVSLAATNAYWTGPALQRHLDEAFAEWKRRLLSGDAREGAGPDAVGVGGGFDPWLADLARTTFTRPKPIIAYEGGPSIYTDNIDGGDVRDDGTTIFMEAMNRHPAMADVYNIHLNMARSKGLRSHVAFVDCGSWGKYGQWGHLEYLDQDPNVSVKWRFLLDWISQFRSIRPMDQPLGQAPAFGTGHVLPVATVGQPYTAAITAEGGDGLLTITKVGDYLVDGLRYEPDPGDPSKGRVTGTPGQAGLSYVYLRVTDRDGDPAWRTFTIRSVGGPGVLAESNFTGADPGLHLPWTAAYVTAPGLVYSGWTAGSGVQMHGGNDMLVWSVSAPASEDQSTLSLAIADKEYLSIRVAASAGKALDLRTAEVSLLIRRIDYHSPRRYAVLTSVDGFTDQAAVFTTSRIDSTSDEQLTFTLPNTAAYSRITGPFELRLYGFSGQYAGHKTSLLSFRLNGQVATP
jgi:hypothetical protein